MAPQRVVQPRLDRWCTPLRPSRTRHAARVARPVVPRVHLASTNNAHPHVPNSTQAQGPPPLPRGPAGPPTMPSRPPTFGPPLTTPVRPLDVTIYYRSDWPQALLHGSIYGGEWTDHPMQAVRVHYETPPVVPSCKTQETLAGVGWHKAVLSVPSVPPSGIAKGPLLEFVLTDGQGSWDKPAEGNFVADAKGTYSVVGGAVNAVAGKPVMVVSDLDDTLIGNDDATFAFTTFWHSQAALVGSKLAYNTGRSLDKFLALLEEKHWCLAEPDCLISSVGTRIYHKKDGRWVEDADYSAFLDTDWDVGVMRDAAYRALNAVGDDVMHFRPPDEQNDHKITCGVMVGVLDQVEDRLRMAMRESGVKAQIITSGTGDWRFVDVISPQAGKLAALEYMRRAWGFELTNTVACGDSGNDIDMLGGRNLAIVVGNAQPDLVRWLDALAPNQLLTADGQATRLYRAKEQRAQGILEGLRAFGFASK